PTHAACTPVPSAASASTAKAAGTSPSAPRCSKASASTFTPARALSPTAIPIRSGRKPSTRPPACSPPGVDSLRRLRLHTHLLEHGIHRGEMLEGQALALVLAEQHVAQRQPQLNVGFLHQ